MKTWWNRFHKRWVVLTGIGGLAEWWLFLRALCFAATVPALMRLQLPTLGRLLERRFKRVARACSAESASERIVHAVESALAVGSPLISTRCLTRGLTLYYFLRRAGLQLSLCFGAGFGQTGFSGHCWLVKDGAPFLEKGEPGRNFVVMYRLPEGSSAHPATN